MTQSFDDWFKNEMPNSHKKVGKEKIETVIYSCAESAWNHKQAEIDELQKRIDDALKAMDGESVNSWGLWKEKADMYEQGASNAYEKSYWILKGTTNEQ